MQPLEGEALLNDFKLAWIQQNSNIIRLNWTDDLKKYILGCDDQACLELLVFLITHIKNKDNSVYVNEFKAIIWKRKERLNLENIVDEILKIVFQKIKTESKYRPLVSKLVAMRLEEQGTVTLPDEIALQLLVTRNLFLHGGLVRLTGLYLKTEKNSVVLRLPKSSERKATLKETINKYLIQASNQNNLEALSPTPAEPRPATSKRKLSDKELEQSDNNSPSK